MSGGPGHNSDVNGVAGDRLRSFLERIERLHSERDAISQDISEVHKEAKAAGFDVKTLKKLVQRRRMDREDREEQDFLLELYERAVEAAPSRVHAHEESPVTPPDAPAKPAPSETDTPDPPDGEVGFLGDGGGDV